MRLILDVFIMVAYSFGKRWIIKRYWKRNKIELKEATDLKLIVSENQLKGFVIYIDHFGNAVTNITKKMFLEQSKGRNYEMRFKNKVIKTILAKYSDIGKTNPEI
jgi:S-adenosylmethionine hydrolase